MFLLGRAHVPGMSLGSRGPRRGSRTRRLCACFVLRFRLFGSVFLARRRGNRRGVRLGGLLFFLLLFRLFLIPLSLRRIFSRSSGVFPRPVSCRAKTCSTIWSNFAPRAIPSAPSSVPTCV